MVNLPLQLEGAGRWSCCCLERRTCSLKIEARGIKDRDRWDKPRRWWNAMQRGRAG